MILSQLFNAENFLKSLNQRQHPEFIRKDVTVEGVLIKNVPVVKNNNSLDDLVSVEILSKIYSLIELYPQEKEIEYNEF